MSSVLLPVAYTHRLTCELGDECRVIVNDIINLLLSVFFVCVSAHVVVSSHLLLIVAHLNACRKLETNSSNSMNNEFIKSILLP